MSSKPRPASHIKARCWMRRVAALAYANELRKVRREQWDRYKGRLVTIKPAVLN